MVTTSIVSGVYNGEKLEEVVNDTITFITRNRLEKRRNELLHKIKNFVPVSEEDKATLQMLLSEKMKLDQEIKQSIK